MNTKHMILALALLSAAAVMACSGDDDSDNTPTASPPQSTTTSPAATPSIEDEVIAGYLKYWEVYSEALFNLDASRLSNVMDGPRLERAIGEISDLEQQGKAVEIDVDNQPAVVEVEGDTAVVLDNYENRSRFIDPQTKEPLSSPGDAEVIRDTVTLMLLDGVWKVFDTVREAE